jgi:hypothetical protein
VSHYVFQYQQGKSASIQVLKQLGFPLSSYVHLGQLLLLLEFRQRNAGAEYDIHLAKTFEGPLKWKDNYDFLVPALCILSKNYPLIPF